MVYSTYSAAQNAKNDTRQQLCCAGNESDDTPEAEAESGCRVHPETYLFSLSNKEFWFEVSQKSIQFTFENRSIGQQLCCAGNEIDDTPEAEAESTAANQRGLIRRNSHRKAPFSLQTQLHCGRPTKYVCVFIYT